MRLALTNCNVIDCITPEPKPGAGVVIEDGRIVEVLERGESAGPADEVIDLDGAYL